MNTNFKKIRFIINPKSGSFFGFYKKKTIQKVISKFLGNKSFDYEIFFTKNANHATALSCEAALLKYDLVIAVGGDGTINEAAKGLVGSETALGIIPLGSGNGYSRHLKIPQSIDRALLAIFKGEYKLVDTLQINNEFILGVAGMGFDAHIAKKFASSKNRGVLSYIKLIVEEFFKYKAEKYELFVDGNKMSKVAFLLSFAKSSQYGNNIIIAPNAKLDDGYINLTILKTPPLWAIFDIIYKLRHGLINKSKYYETFLCKEVIIKKKNINVHLDGEPYLINDLARIKIFPKSLKILMPSKN